MTVWIISIAIVYTLIGFSLSTEWNSPNETIMFKLTYVTSIPQMDNLVSFRQKIPLPTCKFMCTDLKYVAFFYIKNNETCLCSSEVYANTEINENAGVIYGVKTAYASIAYVQGGNQKVKRVHRQPELFDCLALYQQGYTEDGVYVIKPTAHSLTDVWCDMSNGGWTVIQRRQDGSEDFYRNLEEYKNGFGNTTGEYWLGLENMHYLTINTSSLYVYMETFENDNVDPVSAYAEYSTFRINHESDKYRLSVGGYGGSCGDSMSYHNNNQFTTKDNDNDQNGDRNCAVYYSGAWWYNSCHRANLNGLYLDGADTDFGRGINWRMCWGYYYSLKKSVMKIRRND